MTTYSKATLGGRPLHPMMVGIPILLYVATVVSFIVYAMQADSDWFRIGMLCNLAAVIAALVTAIPGFIDWSTAIPANTEAKRVGALHMGANLLALTLFVANLLVHRDGLMASIDDRMHRLQAIDPYLPLAFTVSGFALVLIAGTLGYRLVHHYHVADVPTPGPSRPGPGTSRPIRHH
jgi:uncharacterized membrane protein